MILTGGSLVLTIYRELQHGEFSQAMKIRLEVFVEEQQVPLEEEHDSHDLTATHFGVFQGGSLVGTGRLMIQERIGTIGRVAILREFRGLGLGGELIQAMIKHAKDWGVEELLLGAQVQALGFYEKLGFRAEGPVFQDGGIDHRIMRYHVGGVKEMEK